MNDKAQNIKPTLFAIFGVLIVLAIISSVLMRSSNTNNATTSTQFTGIYGTGSDNILANYTGQTSANSDAAHQNFSIFDQANLRMADDIKSQLNALLGKALNKEITPVQGTTVIQINPATIKCSSIYNCGFSFYIASPESYFSYRLFYQPDGKQVYTLTRLPISEAKQ